MLIYRNIFIITVLLCCSALWADFCGYSRYTELKNPVCRVVIVGELGCRVMEFSYRGENSLVVNPRHNGITWQSGPEKFSPSGGRFDVGPELTAPEHRPVWLGTWSGKKSSPLTAVWQSPAVPGLPFSVQREFRLDPQKPQLFITQTVKNTSNRSLMLHHWGRGWFRPRGTVVIPLAEKGMRRFPNNYVQYENELRNWTVNLKPDDPAFTEKDGLLFVKPLPKFSKNTFECAEPWAGYLLPYGQLLVVRFPIDLKKASPEITGGNFSICFNKWFCEMEPIGPRETVAPGESFSFTETWELHSCSSEKELRKILKTKGKTNL